MSESDARSESGSFLGSAAAYFAGQGSFVAAKGACLIVVARLLGPADFGLYTLVTMTSNLVSSLGVFGMHHTAVYYFSRQKWTREIVFLILAQGVVVGGLLAAGSWLALGLFPALFAGISRLLGLLLAVAIPFRLVDGVLDGIFAGEKRFLVLGLRRSARWWLTLAALLGLWLTGSISLLSAFAATTAASVVVVVVSLVLVAVRHPPVKLPGWEVIRQCYAYSFSMYLYTLCQRLWVRLDYFLVKWFADASTLGLYGLVTNINEVLLQVPRGLYTLIFPRVADLGSRATELAARTCRVLSLLLWAGFLFLLLGGRWVLLLVGGSQYVEAFPLLIAQYPFIVFISLATTLAGVLAGESRASVLLRYSGLGLLALLLVDLALIPALGALGAALGRSVSAALYFLLLARSAGRRHGLTLRHFLVPGREDLAALRLAAERLRRGRRRAGETASGGGD